MYESAQLYSKEVLNYTVAIRQSIPGPHPVVYCAVHHALELIYENFKRDFNEVRNNKMYFRIKAADVELLCFNLPWLNILHIF